jgi:hypothetical protein
MRQKRAPVRIAAPHCGHRWPAGAVCAAKGERQLKQKRAFARTDALQLGQTRREPLVGAVAASPLFCGSARPQSLQKRAPWRSAAPQRGQASAGAGDRLHRHSRQKRACGRLSVPHSGQAFMGLYSSTTTIFPDSLPIALTSTDPFAYQRPPLLPKTRLPPSRGWPNTLPVNGCIVPSGSITHQKCDASQSNSAARSSTRCRIASRSPPLK